MPISKDAIDNAIQPPRKIIEFPNTVAGLIDTLQRFSPEAHVHIEAGAIIVTVTVARAK